ncbi:hypothetical protein FACS189421_12070 [Bacteroidia bacterium]|nr:hypothetical protein FACS189421_12070 [Bacteroidia bacterium]GHT50915.1 hypothetical protein FACS189440_19160 [Bacteroidia bacterium]
MIRTVFTPDSNLITFPIPNKYVGKELEITVFPIKDISLKKARKKVTTDIDPAFGAWADMDKSTEEICAEIKNSRTFRKRDLVL